MKQIEQLKIKPLQVTRQSAGTREEEMARFRAAQKPRVGLGHFPWDNGRATAKEVRATTPTRTKHCYKKSKAHPSLDFPTKEHLKGGSTGLTRSEAGCGLVAPPHLSASRIFLKHASQEASPPSKAKLY